MAHEITWDDARVTVRYFEIPNDSELICVVVGIQGDERFDSTYQALHDFSECEGISYHPLTIGEIVAMNIEAAVSNKRLRIAVVSENPDVKKMFNYFDDFGQNPFVTRLFPCRAEADAWLDGRASPAA